MTYKERWDKVTAIVDDWNNTPAPTVTPGRALDVFVHLLRTIAALRLSDWESPQTEGPGRLRLDIEPEPEVGAERVVFRQTKGGLFRLDQRKVLRWETYSVRRVIHVDTAEPQPVTPDLQAELDRMAPIDPRD